MQMKKWKKALILVPHPDDETIGCGGLLIKLSYNSLIKVILFTQGEKLESHLSMEALREKRIQEFREVMNLLNIKDVEIYDFPDGGLRDYKEKLKTLIKSKIEEYKPDVTVTSYIFDYHEDHKVLGEIIFEIYKRFPEIDFLMYSVYHYVRPNIEIDVTGEIDKLKELFDRYRISLNKKVDIFKNIYIEGIRRLYGMPSERYIEPILYINKFNSMNSLINYILGGSYCTDISFSIVEKIEQYETFLEKVRKLEKELQEREYVLQNYDTELYIKDMYINWLRSELEKELSYKNSIFYRLMLKYRYIVDKYFPEEKLVGRLYRKIVSKIKAWIS